MCGQGIRDGARVLCVFKGGSQSLVSVMVGALPGEVVRSLGQVERAKPRSRARRPKMPQKLYALAMSSPGRRIHYTVGLFIYFPYYRRVHK